MKPHCSEPLLVSETPYAIGPCNLLVKAYREADKHPDKTLLKMKACLAA